MGSRLYLGSQFVLQPPPDEAFHKSINVDTGFFGRIKPMHTDGTIRLYYEWREVYAEYDGRHSQPHKQGGDVSATEVDLVI
ncbi:hypothetical protein FOMA001_g13363 [Fusarium oxysporum f. sp. matthiolae]|jgi:hypothetical protein|nr:hypothetical protein FOMA001_g13363 [Fusarium oxysporum f. sp. matthiolae]